MTAKTYIIAQGAYPFRGEPASMRQFVGTFRALLLDLSGVGADAEDDEHAEEDDDTLPIADLSDAALAAFIVNGVNDDGYTLQVWCVEDGRVVLDSEADEAVR